MRSLTGFFRGRACGRRQIYGNVHALPLTVFCFYTVATGRSNYKNIIFGDVALPRIRAGSRRNGGFPSSTRPFFLLMHIVAQNRIHPGLIAFAGGFEKNRRHPGPREWKSIAWGWGKPLRPFDQSMSSKPAQSGSSRMARSISSSVMASTRAQSVRSSPLAIFPGSHPENI